MSISRGEGVPVRHEIETVVPVLKLDPVTEGSHKIAEMELSAGLHSAQYPVPHIKPPSGMRKTLRMNSISSRSGVMMYCAIPVTHRIMTIKIP